MMNIKLCETKYQPRSEHGIVVNTELMFKWSLEGNLSKITNESKTAPSTNQNEAQIILHIRENHEITEELTMMYN